MSNEEDDFKKKLSGCYVCCYIGFIIPFIIACEKGVSVSLSHTHTQNLVSRKEKTLDITRRKIMLSDVRIWQTPCFKSCWSIFCVSP